MIFTLRSRSCPVNTCGLQFHCCCSRMFPHHTYSWSGQEFNKQSTLTVWLQYCITVYFNECTSVAPRKYVDTTETFKCLSIIALDQCFSKCGAGQIFYWFKGGYDQNSVRTTALDTKYCFLLILHKLTEKMALDLIFSFHWNP